MLPAVCCLLLAALLLPLLMPLLLLLALLWAGCHSWQAATVNRQLSTVRI